MDPANPRAPFDVSDPCLCAALREATRAVTNRYDAALAPLGLSIGQYTLLAHLSANGESRVSALATALLLEQTTALRNLRPLVERRYVVQRKGKDRRERHMSLAPAGAALLRKAQPLWEATQTAMRGVVSSSFWDVLFDALTEVTVGAAAIE